jgi:DNA-binding transcriptional LysR family regulator
VDTRQLEHFTAVAKHLSFTRAAREVHVVQSSLSASVQALERELGAPLFERTTRRVGLTAAGVALLPRAHRILSEVAAARRMTAEVSGVLRGRVALGTIQMLTCVDLPTVLGSFQRAHPGVEVALYESTVDDLLDDLLAGTLDLAYVARDDTPLPAGTKVLMTYEEELVVVVATDHPLARHRHVLLADLADERFVKFQGGAGLQRVVEQLCADAGLDRNITVRVSGLELLLSMVRRGLGISVVPTGVVRDGDLVRLRIMPSHPLRTVALVARESGLTNPAALALMHALHGAGNLSLT